MLCGGPEQATKGPVETQITCMQLLQRNTFLSMSLDQMKMVAGSAADPGVHSGAGGSDAGVQGGEQINRGVFEAGEGQMEAGELPWESLECSQVQGI